MAHPTLRIRVAGSEFVCHADSPATIGSSPDATVPVDHPGISRLHATVRWHGDLWQLEDAASLNGTFHRGARVDRLAVRGPTSVRLGHPDQGLSMELEPVPAPEDHAAHPATQGLEVRSAGSADALWDMPWERLVDQVAQSSPEAVLQARVAMEVAASQQRLIWALWILAGAAVVLAAIVAIVALV